MTRDKGFYEYVINEVFAGIPSISSRGMFGGWGIYKDGIFFALIADGRLYFKVDESNRREYEQAGSQPFQYASKNKKAVSMSYWELPAEVMDDTHELQKWVEKSVAIKKKK